MKWGGVRSGIRTGVRRLFRLDVRTPERTIADADDELRSFLEMRVEHLVARGMPTADAEAEAVRRLGGTMDEVRTAIQQSALQREKTLTLSDRIDWIRQDTGVALRGLRNAPAFTATVVLTLALGAGANAAVFSILNRIYLRQPAGIAQSGELRRIFERLPANHPMNGDRKEMFVGGFDYPTFNAMRKEAGARADLFASTGSDSESIGRGQNAVPVRVAKVSDNYFSALRVQTARGRFFASGEGDPDHNSGVAVLSYDLWERAYSRDESIVGQKIEVNKKPYVIIGVAAKDFTGTELNKSELFLGLGALEGRQSQGRPWYLTQMGSYLRLMARVPHGDDGPFVALATVVNRRFGADLRGQQPPGTSLDTSSTIVTGPIIAALGPASNPKEYAIGIRLAGVAAIVLLIACANIANLLLVRAVRRRHEVAVRVALGVSRFRLLAQFLTEGAILSALGAAAAIIVAAWGGSLLRTLILPYTHWATPALDFQVLGFTLAVALTAGTAAALFPALRGSRVDIVSALKPGSRGGEHSRSRVRSALLAAQTALSLVLLVGAGLFVKSLRELHSVPTGYAADELAFASIDFDEPGSHNSERLTALPRAAERIAALPGVRGVALAEIAPMRGGAYRNVYLDGRDSAVFPSYNRVSSEFFSVTGMRIVAGRALSTDDRRGAGGSVVVNETMAKKYWPGGSAIGQCVRIDSRSAGCSLVVGVAEDGKQMSVLEKYAQAQYFVPLRAMVDSETAAPHAIIIRTQAGGSRAVQDVARSELRLLVPNASDVNYMTMVQSLAPELRPWRLGAYLFTAFGLLALLVATVGVYGVIAYSFSQRTHELGVRTALGASARDTYTLVLGESLRLTALGVAAGIALSIALAKLIASLLYNTSARDPLVIALAAIALVVAGTAASVLPAWRAAKTDPMIALRAD